MSVKDYFHVEKNKFRVLLQFKLEYMNLYVKVQSKNSNNRCIIAEMACLGVPFEPFPRF